MDDKARDIIAQLAPPELLEEPNLWKRRQSLATKAALIEATVLSLAEIGYARTNQLVIAERSGVSRGGIQHHYPNYLDLISSVADYTFYRRCQAATDALAAARDAERPEVTYIEIAWATMEMTEYQAYLELVVASRTFPEVREIMTPKVERFDQLWLDLILKLQPDWAERLDRFRMANDLFRVFFDGLVLNANLWTRASRIQAMRDVFPRLVDTVWAID